MAALAWTLEQSDRLLLIASVLVAIPTIRAAYRILLARFKFRAAARKEVKLQRRAGQDRQAQSIATERLKNQANDLIEFSTLVPSWAVCLGLLGIVLNVGVRAAQVFSAP